MLCIEKVIRGCDCKPVGNKVITNLLIKPGLEDLSAVATLPDDWVPKRSGNTLANYLQDREKSHKTLLQDLADEISEVNKKIDSKIRELTEILMSRIQHNQRQIDRIIQLCENGDHPLSQTKRDTALKDIQVLYNDRLHEISEFRKSGLKLEYERADCLRITMRDQFQRLVKISHYSLKDLLHDFDDRMYETNQQLLCNIRAYSEVEDELHALADENVVKARSMLNQLCLGVATAYRCQSARRSSYRNISTMRTSSAIESRKYFLEPSMQKVISTDHEEIEKCVSEIVEEYRQAVHQTFTGFSGNLSDLHKNLTCFNLLEMGKAQHHTVKCFKLEQMIESVLKRLSRSYTQSMTDLANNNMDYQLEKTRQEVFSVQNSLLSLGECLRNTYKILHDAGHVWDDHMLRSAYAQKLTVAAVEDLLTNNDVNELINELNFTELFEKMCCSADVEKLNSNYNALFLILDDTEKMYNRHSLAEIDRLEQFMLLLPSLSNVLMAELQCFLAKYPRKPPAQGTRLSNTQHLLSVKPVGLLTRIIRQTELQEVALMNWRNGFLEAFESNIPQVPEELFNQARLWVDERSIPLNMRCSLKLVAHNVRKGRIQAAYKARLAELQHHENRLESHLKAIELLVSTLPEEALNCLSLNASVLYPLSDWIDHIKTDMEAKLLSDPDNITEEFKTMKMVSYASRVKKYHELFLKSVDEQIDEKKMLFQQRIQNARIATVRFMNNIKLLSEGGKYAAAEALKTGDTLLKAENLLETCEMNTFDALSVCRGNLKAAADEVIANIQNIVSFDHSHGEAKPQKAKLKSFSN